MAHHLGSEKANIYWAEHWNNLIYRICQLYPDNFVPVGMLPQFPGVEPKNCIAGDRAHASTSSGSSASTSTRTPRAACGPTRRLFDEWWYPVYEKMVELDIPAMVHVSQTRNPAFHFTGAHYINADTTAFMQCPHVRPAARTSRPCKFIIPHGGGAVPYHWGRYRGLAQDNKWTPATELIKDYIYFDTCVYHQPGIDLLLKVIPPENILFGSEMVGAVRGHRPRDGVLLRRHEALRRHVRLSPEARRR